MEYYGIIRKCNMCHKKLEDVDLYKTVTTSYVESGGKEEWNKFVKTRLHFCPVCFAKFQKSFLIADDDGNDIENDIWHVSEYIDPRSIDMKNN